APELLTTLYRRVNLGKTACLHLLRADGISLARYTTSKGLDTWPAGRMVQDIKAVIDSKFTSAGEFTNKSPFDGVTRILHWRKVTGYPLIVVVGLGEAEVLAAANHQAWNVIGLGLVAL